MEVQSVMRDMRMFSVEVQLVMRDNVIRLMGVRYLRVSLCYF